MSPYDYNDDVLWSEREKETIVTDVRHNFAFVFQQVVMINKFYYTDSNLSTKVDEVMESSKKMFEKEQLSEYLYKNLLSAYKQYPTMLIGNLKDEEKKIGEKSNSKDWRNSSIFWPFLSVIYPKSYTSWSKNKMMLKSERLLENISADTNNY